MIGVSSSFNMKQVKAPHVPPCEGGEMPKEQQAVVDRYREQQSVVDWCREADKGVSISAARALEKCPVAQRDDEYDTLY